MKTCKRLCSMWSSTYDPNNGRRIYVNGVFTDDADGTTAPGLLGDWDDTFALAIGSEVDNANQWAGVVRLLAIHNRALTSEQIAAELRCRGRREVLHAVQRFRPCWHG